MTSAHRIPENAGWCDDADHKWLANPIGSNQHLQQLTNKRPPASQAVFYDDDINRF